MDRPQRAGEAFEIVAIGRRGDVDVLGEDRGTLQPGGDPADHHEVDVVIGEDAKQPTGSYSATVLSGHRAHRVEGPHRVDQLLEPLGGRAGERASDQRKVMGGVVVALEDQLVTERPTSSATVPKAGSTSPRSHRPIAEPGWPDCRPSSACDRPAR